MAESINVHPSGLAAFAEDVRWDTTQTFQPDVARAHTSMGDTVPFGHSNAGLDVLAAKEAYAAARDASMENMRRFGEAADILSGVAEKVAAELQAADGRAEVNVDKVTGMLTAAADEAQRLRLTQGPVAPDR
jgi:hypothetical protein